MSNIKSAFNWLKVSPYGIILAYIICIIISYLAIWSFIEPLNIPEKISNLNQLPKIISERSFLHVIASFITAAFLTLILDIIFRQHVIKIYKDLTRSEGSPLVYKNLIEYDEAFNDLCTQLAYAIGRYQDHVRDPARHDVKYAMDRVNEVRRARLRFLKVCGSKCQSLLTESGTEWFRDLNSFSARAYEIETRLSSIVNEDREIIQKEGMATGSGKTP